MNGRPVTWNGLDRPECPVRGNTYCSRLQSQRCWNLLLSTKVSTSCCSRVTSEFLFAYPILLSANRKLAVDASMGLWMALMAPSSRNSITLSLISTEFQEMKFKDSSPRVLNVLFTMCTLATVTLMAPYLDIDWITDWVRFSRDMPATMAFWERELMLQAWMLRFSMTDWSEKAPRSILLTETRRRVTVFIRNPEKAEDWIRSTRQSCSRMCLKEEEKRLDDSALVDTLMNRISIVGSRVGTYISGIQEKLKTIY